MLNVLLVIFGGLAMHLFFLAEEPVRVEAKVDQTAELVTKIQSLKQQAQELAATKNSLESTKQVYADRIIGLQKELAEAEARKSSDFGTGPAFFENKIRQQQSAAGPTLQQLQDVDSKISQLAETIKQLETQLLQMRANERRESSSN